VYYTHSADFPGPILIIPYWTTPRVSKYTCCSLVHGLKIAEHVQAY